MYKKTTCLCLITAFLIPGCRSGDISPAAAATNEANYPALQPTKALPTATQAPTLTGVPSPTVPGIDNSQEELSLDWPVTAEELNSFSEDIGITDWELLDTKQSEFRACHIFEGQSWSSSKNQAYNCIFKSNPDLTIDQAINFMFDTEWFFSDEIPIETSLNVTGGHALYIGESPNGHAVFDLIVLDGNFMYWASISIGVDITLVDFDGEKIYAEYVYEEYQDIIDAFLENIVLINSEKVSSS